MFFVQMILYTVTRFFVRASIILFYLRVFTPRSDKKSKFNRVLKWTMVFNAVYSLAFLVAVILQCRPIPYFWTQWEGLNDGHCGNSTILVWVAAFMGVAFDVWLLALPFPQLFALNLTWKKKVMGGVMFSVGAAYVLLSFNCWNCQNELLIHRQCGIIVFLSSVLSASRPSAHSATHPTPPVRYVPPGVLQSYLLGSPN